MMMMRIRSNFHIYTRVGRKIRLKKWKKKRSRPPPSNFSIKSRTFPFSRKKRFRQRHHPASFKEKISLLEMVFLSYSPKLTLKSNLV